MRRYCLRGTLAAAAVLALVPLVGTIVRGQQSTLAIPDRSNGTPWVAADGTFVAVVWGATREGRSDVYAAVSRNGGHAFDAPVRVNTIAGEARLGGELPPRVAVRRSGATSPDPEVAVLWTARGGVTAVKLARSRDGGRTFGAASALQSPDAPGDRGWPALALSTQGDAHAIWLDHRGLAAPAGTKAAHAGHGSGGTHDGVAMAQKSGVYHAAAAAAAPGEREIARGVCYCCKTALVAAPDGRLFAAWRHVYPGNLRDMALSVSTDRGHSFSAPIRVSEDGWEIDGCPDDGPAMAVDGGGTVHLVWPTVIGGEEPEGALYYASTRDGRAFSPRQRIPGLGSPKPMHPQIAVDAAGRIVVAWEELMDGRRVAALREVKPGSGSEAFGPVLRLSEKEPGAYPVLAATASGFVAVWTAGSEGSAQVRVRPFSLP